MTDLGGDNKLPTSPNDKSKFHFKFPQLSIHHEKPNEVIDKDALGMYVDIQGKKMFLSIKIFIYNSELKSCYYMIAALSTARLSLLKIIIRFAPVSSNVPLYETS